MNDINSIVEWFHSDSPHANLGDRVLECYHALHPRTTFLKGLPVGTKMLDMGAGDGGMHIYREWPAPPRLDLKLYAFSLEKGVHFDSYNGYEIGNWEECPPSFDGLEFDAVFSAHFIEHIRNLRSYFQWSSSRLASGGQMFTEWPAERALHAPTKSELHSFGIDLIVGNYYDDPTHRQWPSMKQVLRAMRDTGLEVELAGIIRLPLYETELLAYYRKTGDVTALQFAYWSRTGWCQYLVARKVGAVRRPIAKRVWNRFKHELRPLRRAIRSG